MVASEFNILNYLLKKKKKKKKKNFLNILKEYRKKILNF